MKGLDPINFAYVMATGGISIIFRMAGWEKLSLLFFVLTAISYFSLIFLFAIRIFLFRKQFKREMVNIYDLFEYLTFGAGTNVLAICFILRGSDAIGTGLGLLGIASIIILIYYIFSTFFFGQNPYLESLSPVWLLMGIACHTIGITITALWQHGIIQQEIFLFLAFCFWSFGIVLYLIFMTLNIYRMFFFPFVGKDFFPAYWTCMGAAAIAVVDGGKLVLVDQAPLFLEIIKPYIQGTIFLLWGWGTLWIPILCLMEIWKYGPYKVPFRYHPSLWAMVFPLAMYTAATDLLSSNFHLEFLQGMVPVCMWISFACWLVIFGMIGMSFRKTNSLKGIL